MDKKEGGEMHLVGPGFKTLENLPVVQVNCVVGIILAHPLRQKNLCPQCQPT